MTWLEKKQGQLRMGWAKTAIAGEINYLPLTLLASYISMPTLLVSFKSPFFLANLCKKFFFKYIYSRHLHFSQQIGAFRIEFYQNFIWKEKPIGMFNFFFFFFILVNRHHASTKPSSYISSCFLTLKSYFF